MQSELRNFEYAFSDLNINVGLIEKAMGYPIGQSPEPFPEMITFALGQCEELCDIKGSLLISKNFSLDISDYFIAE